MLSLMIPTTSLIDSWIDNEQGQTFDGVLSKIIRHTVVEAASVVEMLTGLQEQTCEPLFTDQTQSL